MAVEITSLPEFGPAMATYKQEKDAAVAAGDQLAITQADLNWERKRAELMQLAMERDSQNNARTAALEKIKAEFGEAPEEVYAHIQDPEEMRKVAKSVHERIVAAKGETGDNGQSWGTPPGTAPAGGPPQEAPQKLTEIQDEEKFYEAREAEINRLGPVAMAGGKASVKENEQLRKATLSPIIRRFTPGKAPR